ncbi:hypothetical protein RRG08_012966 [Elysia crispata]|uniref:Uncharacterized protein n=1 Tax=Elysia crispata TaxID=231223 RepID=A0AAE1DR72_9GAST|nr:hypothetical protein RRG08_012966 [Elysia crispata]
MRACGATDNASDYGSEDSRKPVESVFPFELPALGQAPGTPWTGPFITSYQCTPEHVLGLKDDAINAGQESKKSLLWQVKSYQRHIGALKEGYKQGLLAAMIYMMDSYLELANKDGNNSSGADLDSRCSYPDQVVRVRGRYLYPQAISPVLGYEQGMKTAGEGYCYFTRLTQLQALLLAARETAAAAAKSLLYCVGSSQAIDSRAVGPVTFTGTSSRNDRNVRPGQRSVGRWRQAIPSLALRPFRVLKLHKVKLLQGGLTGGRLAEGKNSVVSLAL